MSVGGFASTSIIGEVRPRWVRQGTSVSWAPRSSPQGSCATAEQPEGTRTSGATPRERPEGSFATAERPEGTRTSRATSRERPKSLREKPPLVVCATVFMRRRANKSDSSSSSTSSSSSGSSRRLIINTWVRQLPRKMGEAGRLALPAFWSLIVVPFRC